MAQTRDAPLPLKVHQLSYGYGQQLIFDEINCQLEAGQVLAICGANGVGKSTLLRCLSGYYSPHSGYVEVGTQRLDRLAHRQQAQLIALVQQQTDLSVPMTVKQLLATGLLAHRLAHRRWWQWHTSRREQRWLEEVAERFQISHLLPRFVSELSGGQQQRLMIARAVLQRPRLLLLDEPSNHLDVCYQLEVMQLIRNLGCTVVVTLHDLNLASRFADQVLLLQAKTDNAPSVLALGTPAQVFTQANLKQAFAVDTIIDQHPQDQSVRINYCLAGSHVTHSNAAHGSFISL